MNTILLVEDDRTAREGLSQLLRSAGFSVTAATDGIEALEKLKEQHFDAMLLDIWLPRMNGLQVLGLLQDKEDQPKVIVMTADDSPETLLLTLRKQAHQFVRKPIQPGVLLELLRTTLAAPGGLPDIVVLSGRPAWVEVLAPCALDVADRIQSYIVNLDVDLPEEVRKTVGLVFRELLLDAMEWGGLDPNRKVRIAYLHARRMLLYRIADAGYGFRRNDLPPGHPSESAAPGGSPGAEGRYAEASRETAAFSGGDGRLRPGILLARAEADELLFNEARDEVVVVKYQD